MADDDCLEMWFSGREGKGMIDDVRVAKLSEDVHLLGEQVGRGV